MSTSSSPGQSAFGDLLHQYRLTAGLTQEALAERAGLSVRGISDLERGIRTRPQRGTVRMLADALGLEGPTRAALLSAAHHPPASSPPHAQTPAAKATVATPPRLPVFHGPLFGRGGEVAVIGALLAEHGAQLVTLTGPGGTGKTRLAVAVAAEVGNAFAGGVDFADLAPLHDPDLVVPQIATGYGVRESAGESLAEALTRALGSKRRLLVLDNCEHLLPAAPAIGALLATCPALTILATSRGPLRLRAERIFPVSTLALPPASATPLADVLDTPAVALFVERALAADPAFTLTEENAAAVATICRELDGLPLAIELAAARIRHLPPAALLSRLAHRLSLLTGGARDLPPRQQTLRDTIAWSYDLLDPEEQTLFQRLAAFAGGWTLDAAEWVTGLPDGGDGETLDIMGALIDKSLVHRVAGPAGEPRYSMLETIREFAADRLAASGEEAAVRRAHLAYLIEFVREDSLDGAGPDLERRLAGLAAEEANLRAALEWGLRDDPLGALALIAGIGNYWWIQGRLATGLTWLERVLASVAGVEHPDRARALSQASWLALNLGDCDRAEELAATSFELAERLGESRYAAYARYCQGSIAMTRVEGERGTVLLEDALARFELVGDVWGASACFQDLGLAALDRADGAAAVSCFVRCLEIATAHQGDDRARAGALSNLAEAYRCRGDTESAWTLAGEAAALAERAGGAYGMTKTRELVARLELDREEVSQAAALVHGSPELWWEMGDRWSLAQALELVAATAAVANQAERAAELYGAVETLREAISSPISGYARADQERALAVVRAALGEPAFTRAWLAGRATPLAEAVAGAEAVLELIAGAERSDA